MAAAPQLRQELRLEALKDKPNIDVTTMLKNHPDMKGSAGGLGGRDVAGRLTQALAGQILR